MWSPIYGSVGTIGAFGAVFDFFAWFSTIAAIPLILIGSLVGQHKLGSKGRRVKQAAIMGSLIMSGPWADTPTSEIRMAWYNVRPKYRVKVEVFEDDKSPCAEHGQLLPINWGQCLTLGMNVTSWKMQGHHRKDVPAMPEFNCVMHYFSAPDCQGDLVGLDLHVNHREALHVCRKAPWTLLDTSTPTFRSMRLDCCQAPFCEVPNPASCVIERTCRDPVKFQHLKDTGLVPQQFPPPPPVQGLSSNQNCSFVASGWTEALQRSWFNRGTPNASWATSFDPVWWESEVFEKWAP